MIANIIYHLDNNYFAYFYTFGPAVLQKSEKIDQKPVFHESTDFSLKMNVIGHPLKNFQRTARSEKRIFAMEHEDKELPLSKFKGFCPHQNHDN